MTNQEKLLLNEYVSGNLSKEKFLKKYPVNLVENKQYIFSSLNEAYKNKNADDVGYTLLLLVFDEDFNKNDNYVEILCKLLYEDWHFSHENIVSLLQGIKSPESIDALFKTALTEFKYLDYDDTHALARKCIHALGEINTESAKEKLKQLAQSPIPIIKEKAEKQLYYYRR